MFATFGREFCSGTQFFGLGTQILDSPPHPPSIPPWDMLFVLWTPYADTDKYVDTTCVNRYKLYDADQVSFGINIVEAVLCFAVV